MYPLTNARIAITFFLTAFLLFPFLAEAGQGTVVFDEGHGQRFVISKTGALHLSRLADLVQKQGVQVKTSTDRITDEVLSGAEALVISGPFAGFSHAEVDTIINFVRNGGRLCLMLHIGKPVGPLLKKLHVFVSNGVVHEAENIIEGTNTDYFVSPTGSHPVLQGIEQFKVFGGWALVSDDGSAAPIAQTSASGWIDRNMNHILDGEESQRPLFLAMAGTLGEGGFVVFGDDAVFQNRFLQEGNLQLGKNLAAWLAGAN